MGGGHPNIRGVEAGAPFGCREALAIVGNHRVIRDNEFRWRLARISNLPNRFAPNVAENCLNPLHLMKRFVFVRSTKHGTQPSKSLGCSQLLHTHIGNQRVESIARLRIGPLPKVLCCRDDRKRTSLCPGSQCCSTSLCKDRLGQNNWQAPNAITRAGCRYGHCWSLSPGGDLSTIACADLSAKSASGT